MSQKIADSRTRGGRNFTPLTNQNLDKPENTRIAENFQMNPRKGLPRGVNGASDNLARRLREGDLEKAKCLTVLIADDHPVVREGISTLINRRSDMRVVAEAGNGREAVEKFFSFHPDVALIDLRMPVMDGIEAVIAICDREPMARLVILTTFQSEEDVYLALRAGVRGYVLKDAKADDLIACIHAVGEGGTWIPPEVGAKLARRVTDQELTAREMEVLRAVATGKSNKEIGTAFDISEGTVKVHVTHILEKLKVTGRTEAINVAVKRGLVRMDSANGR